MDYRDTLVLRDATAAYLSPGHLNIAVPEAGVPEPKQCLLLQIAAGILQGLSRGGTCPLKVADVKALACTLRISMARQAAVALSCLGPCPAEVGQTEADLRTFVHDALTFGHDRDYRALAAFPLAPLRKHCVNVVRVDSRGRVACEALSGWNYAGAKSNVIWVLIHRGHMRLLTQPEAILEHCCAENEIVSAGWEAHLESAHSGEALVSKATLLECPICAEAVAPDVRQGWRSGRVSLAFGRNPLHPRVFAPDEDAEWEELQDTRVGTDRELFDWLGDQAPILERAKQRGWLDLVEVYADKGRVSAQVLEMDGTAIRVGLAWGHDLTRSRDRRLLFQLIEFVPVKHVLGAFPCTAFCAWVRLNLARGADLSRTLAEGKGHLALAMQVAGKQRKRGGHVHLENPLTSHAWVEPVAVKELTSKRSDGSPAYLAARLDQCTFPLRPEGGRVADGPHKKPTLIHTTDSDMALAMSRTCTGNHEPIQVQGSYTKAASTYPVAMAKAMADVIMKPDGGGAIAIATESRKSGSSSPPPAA